jgi:hypothetical protein
LAGFIASQDVFAELARYKNLIPVLLSVVDEQVDLSGTTDQDFVVRIWSYQWSLPHCHVDSFGRRSSSYTCSAARTCSRRVHS